MSKLPQGVWTVLADILAAEGNGEQWMTRKKNRWQVNHQWNPLRALTQVSQTTRAAAMPAMWRHVKLNAKNEDFPNVISIDQLARELSLGSVNSRGDITFTSSLPLGARAYVETIDIDVRLEQTGPIEEGTERPIHPGHVVERDYVLLRAPSGPFGNSVSLEQSALPWTLHELSASLDSLSHKLPGCPQLKHFGWRSSFVPSELSLSLILRCLKLESLALDLRGNTFDDLADRFLYPDSCQCTARLQSPPKPGKLKCISIGLDTYDHSEADPDYHLQRGQTFSEVGVELTDWLLGFPIFRSLRLAAPDLLHQRWMLPIWAQLEELQEWSITDDEPGTERDPGDERYWLAATRFPALLQEQVWPAFRQKRHLSAIDTASNSASAALATTTDTAATAAASASATATSNGPVSTIEGVLTLTATGPIFSITDIVAGVGGDSQSRAPSGGGQTLLFPKQPPRRKMPKVPDILEKLAHDIFQLIQSHADLAPWRVWFSSWDKPSHKALDSVSTRTILLKVAEVLADKCGKTSDKRGLKRKRWHEEIKHKCPCSCDVCDVFSETSWAPSDMTEW